MSCAIDATRAGDFPVADDRSLRYLSQSPSSCDSFDIIASPSSSISVLSNTEDVGTKKTGKRKESDDSSDPTTPKKKRYSKSRTKNRSPQLVMKLRKTRRSKANDRERSRMHSLNDALESLREVLPDLPDETKLTKIETLRFAHNYIWALSETLKICDTKKINGGMDSLSALIPSLFQQSSDLVSDFSGTNSCSASPSSPQRSPVITTPMSGFNSYFQTSVYDVQSVHYGHGVPSSPTEYSDTSDGYGYEYIPDSHLC